MADPSNVKPCPVCGAAVRVLAFREKTLYYVCDQCRTQGAYFPAMHP